MEENKKQLYDFLVGEGLFEGTDKSFDSMYSDDDGINFLYKSLSETGYYQGSDKDFKDQFFTPKKKDLTWSQDFGKAYESMPQGSPTKTKSVTTPSASTNQDEGFVGLLEKGLQLSNPVVSFGLNKGNKASEKELKAEERFVNYTNAIGNINKRIESISKSGEALVNEYNGLAQEMQSLNEVMQSKLRPQAEKTQASLRAKQVQDRAALIEQELGQMKSNYQVDLDRKNTLFRAALAQKAIVSNEVEDNFSLLQDFNRKLIGLSVKSIGIAIEGIGDLTEMARTQKLTDEKITDEIGDNIATAGAEVYDQALKRIPESAQWDPEKGLSALTPMKTAVFATNAIASTMPSVFAALSGSKAATVTTSAVMNYGDAYSTARERGFDEQKAALVAVVITPFVTLLDQFGLNQVLKGSKGAFSQFIKTETLKRLAGKELTKDAIFAVTSKVFSEGLKRFAKTAGKIVATEVPTEAIQGAMQEAGIQLADKQKVDWTKLGYATEAEALGGFFGAGAMSVIPGVQAFMFNPTAYSIAMGTNNPEFAADLQDLIKSEIAAGSLTEEEAAEIAQNIEIIKETDKVIPKTVNNKAARVEAINLVNEKNRLKAEMEGMDPAMVLDKKERIRQIDELLTNISVTNLPTNEQTTNTDNATGAGSPDTQTGATGSTTAGGNTNAGGQTPGTNAVDNSPEAVESRRAQIRKDMEIEAFQERTGFKLYDPFEMMPPVVEVTLGRLAEGDTVDPVAIKEASDWLYGEYKRLDAMKQADNRTMTIPQIEEIQAELEGEITALENEYNYAEQQKTEAGATVGQGDQQTEGTPGQTQEVNGTTTQDDQGGKAATKTEPEVTEPTQEGTGSTQETAQNPEPDKLSDESIKYAQDRGVTAPHALSILNKYLPNWRSYPSQEKALDAAFRIQAAKKATKSQASKFKLIAKNPKLMLAVRAINRTFAALGVKSLILNDSDFNSIHESISGQKGSGRLRNAFYDPMTKTMYLKSSNIAQTAFHEVIHPFLESIRTSDKEVYDKIIDRVRNMEAIKPDSSGKTYFDWAKSYYPDRSEYIQDQEAVTEFMADVLGDNVSFTDLLKGEALAVLNDILKYFGYNGTLTKPVSMKFVMENVPNIETIVTKAVANARIFEFEEAATEGEVRDQMVDPNLKKSLSGIIEKYPNSELAEQDGNTIGLDKITIDGEDIYIQAIEHVGIPNAKPLAAWNSKGENVALAIFKKKDDGTWYSMQSETNKDLQRKGIMSAIYDLAENTIGEISESNEQTSEAKSFWKKRKDNKDNEIRDQIVGEKARLDEQTRQNKVIAQEMEDAGKDAKTIRMATGWEKGIDGKWRYEVEDSGMGIKINGDVDSFVESVNKISDIVDYPKLFEAYPELENIKINFSKEGGSIGEAYFDGKEIVIGIGDMFGDIDEYRKLKSEYDLLDPNISSIIDRYRDNDNYQKELQESGLSYSESSELADKKFPSVSDQEMEELFSVGLASKVEETDKRMLDIKKRLGLPSYNLRPNESFFDYIVKLPSKSELSKLKKELSSNKIKSVVLHELQHAVQGIEGFARGGNRTLAYMSLNEKERSEYETLVENKDELLGDLQSKGLFWFDQSKDVKDVVLAPREFLMKKYKSIAGEVEARNVEYRMNMTPEQRRNTLLSETEDVNREDQIIRDQMNSDALKDVESTKNALIPLANNVDLSLLKGKDAYDAEVFKGILDSIDTLLSNFDNIETFGDYMNFFMYKLFSGDKRKSLNRYRAKVGNISGADDIYNKYTRRLDINNIDADYVLVNDITHPFTGDLIAKAGSFVDERIYRRIKKDADGLIDEVDVFDGKADFDTTLSGNDIFYLASSIGDIITNSKSEIAKYVSEAYHEAKKDGRNPELVKSVEDLLADNNEIRDQLTPRRTLEENNIATAKEQEAIEAAANYMQDSADMDELVAEYAAKTDHQIETIISRKTKLTDEGAEDIFAYAEAINRAQSSPDRKFYGRTIPELMTKVAPIGTFAAKVLRFMQLISKPNAKAQTEALVALIENKGYVLSPAQKAELLRRNTDIKNARDAVKAAKENFLNVGTIASRELLEAEQKKLEEQERGLANLLSPMLPVSFLDWFVSNMQGNVQAIPSLVANLTSGIEAIPRATAESLVRTAIHGMINLASSATNRKPIRFVLPALAGVNPFFRGVKNAPGNAIKTLAFGSDVSIDASARSLSNRISGVAAYNAIMNPLSTMRVPGDKVFKVFKTKDEIQVRQMETDIKGPLVSTYPNERDAAVAAKKQKGTKAFGKEVYKMIGEKKGAIIKSYPLPSVPDQAIEDALMLEAEDEAYLLSTKPDPSHKLLFVGSQLFGASREILQRVSSATDNSIREPLAAARLAEEAKRMGKTVDDLMIYAAADETGEFAKYLKDLALSPTYQQDNVISSAIAKAESRIRNNIENRKGITVKAGLTVAYILGKVNMLFAKTPLNIMNRMVDVVTYGTFSLGESAYNFKRYSDALKSGDKIKSDLYYSKAVGALASAVVSYSIMLAARYIADIVGAVVGSYDSLDEKKRVLLKSRGIGVACVNTSAVERKLNGGSSEWMEDDKIVPLRMFGMLGQAMMFQADRASFKEKREIAAFSSGNIERDIDDYYANATDILWGIPKQAFNWSFMAGTNTLLNAINSEEGSKVPEWSRGVTQAVIAGFGVPATYSKAIESEYTPELVEKQNTKQTVKNVFRYRTGLEGGPKDVIYTRIDGLGFPVRNQSQGNSPFQTLKFKKNPLWEKINSIYEQSGDPKVIIMGYRMGTLNVNEFPDIETYKLISEDINYLNSARGAYRRVELEKLFAANDLLLSNGEYGTLDQEPDPQLKAKSVVGAIRSADEMFKPELRKYLLELSRKANYPKLAELEKYVQDLDELN
jgi:hypothetical protein